MSPYMFVIYAVPKAENKHFTSVRGAHVHIWVIDDSPDSALQRATSYIEKYQWLPTEIEHAFDASRMRISDLHEEEQRLYLTALRYGIASDFLAEPLNNSPDSEVYIDRP